MATSLSGTVGALVNLSLSGSPNLGSSKWAYNLPTPQSFSNGTGAGQAQLVFEAAFTATAAPQTYDLVAGGLLDPLGNAAVFSVVNAILILNDDTTAAHTLLYDGTVSNAFAAPLNAIVTAKAKILAATTINGVVTPGGFLSWGFGATAFTVDSTHKIVSIDPGANTVSGRIIVVGH